MKHPVLALRRRTLSASLLALAGLGLGVAPWRAAQAQSFDHGHAAWTSLLKKHVVLLGGGKASQVRYAGFAADRAALKAYLGVLAAVPKASFDGFSKPQQMAFLINAYNAHTVELILTKYPDLKSIKDLGSLLSNPWKQKVAPLLGTTMTLDNIEHDTLRKRGVYDDPRIHFAVNCASVGCPMLREEAFVADRLEAQLDEQAQRFLSDRTRNRYSVDKKRLEVSKIFDWYGEDFKLGHKGYTSLDSLASRHADLLADSADDRAALKRGGVEVSFLEYDWKLNDVRR